MARLSGVLKFTGSLDDYSAYKMWGSEEIIFRKKGGASKARIQKDPKFAPTRKLNNEWKAVIEAATRLRKGLIAMKPLADYNYAGPLNGLVKKVQVNDTLHPKGQRHILFSQQPDFFTGFSFNKQVLFDSLIRQPLKAVIDKTTGVADISVSVLQPLVNFFPHAIHPYYRLIFTCTSVSDMTCDPKDSYFTTACYNLPEYEPLETDWVATRFASPIRNCQMIPVKDFSADSRMIIVCAVGLQYGTPGADGSIQPLPFAGAAKILKSV